MFANRSHVRNEFTNTNKFVKRLARIEASSICRQQFANVFVDCFCAVHTNFSLSTRVAKISLPCEGRLRQRPHSKGEISVKTQLYFYGQT